MDTRPKYTPGPWAVKPLDLFECGDVSGEQGVQIVAADGTVIADNQTFYPHALALENAPLIAAAPELLAALQISIELADRNRDAAEARGVHTVRPPEMQAVYNACCAAVAKATGSAS